MKKLGLFIMPLMAMSFLLNCNHKSSFTITWTNDDGTILEVDENVKYGETPIYNGPRPSKSMTEQFYYDFKGWNKDIHPAVNDETYCATYESVDISGLAAYMTITIPEDDTPFSFEVVPSATGVDIDWGDGSELDINLSVHTYKKAGKYNVRVINNGVENISISAQDNQFLTSIFLGSSITKIADNAFNSCLYLESVTFSNTLSEIGSRAFFMCSSLTSIDIPSGVTLIDKAAFTFCESLISITIPSSVTTIGDEAFAACNYLKSIKIDPDNEYYYDGGDNSNSIITRQKIGDVSANTLIYGCYNTIIPNSVVSIGEKAFMLNANLTSIDIPGNVRSIERNAFAGCMYLESVTLHEGLEKIGNDAFELCISLTSISIPHGVMEIGSSAFLGSFLESVILNEGLRTIKSGAFELCTNLTYIKIPNHVTEIKDRAFYGCLFLTSVDLTALSQPPNLGDYAFDYCSTGIKFFVKNGTKEKYEEAENWHKYSGHFVEVSSNKPSLKSF